MVMFKENERSEVRRWIVDLENLLDEMVETDAGDSEIVEQQRTLAWLRKLIATD